MKKVPVALLASAEAAGLLCGVLMVFCWPLITGRHMPPAVVLLALAIVAALAGFWVGAVSGSQGMDSQLAARRGGKAGVWATLSGSAVYILLTSTLPFFGRTFWPQIIAGASLMPSMLAGTIAAAVGLLCFRPRPAVVEAGAEPLPETKLKELPKLTVWGIRCLIFAGLLLSLIVPFLPQRLVLAQTETNVSRLEQLKAVSPSPPPRPEPPPAPPFRYELPAALLTAQPVSWKIEATRGLGDFPLQYGVAFSSDGRFVASGGDSRDIVVRDLHSEDVRHVGTLPYPMRSLSFSPDGQRLFVVMEGDPRRVGVADLKSGRFIPLPQPKKHAVPEGQAVWWRETSVLFEWKKESMLALDLDTLEFDPARLSDADSLRFQSLANPAFPENDRWRFAGMDIPSFTELPEVEGTPDWRWQGGTKLMLADLKHISQRVFEEIELQKRDQVYGPPDGSKVLWCREGRATAVYFTTGPVPPLSWKISLPHGPDRLKPTDAARQAAETGQLSLLLYPPLINPLNNRSVGPDREHPKAILRIRNWTGIMAEVWVEAGTYPWAAGDVFADVYVPGNPPVLLAFDQPHRWWTEAPAPEQGSDDPSKLPLWTDLPQPKPKLKETDPAVAVAADTLPPPTEFNVSPQRLEQIRKQVPKFLTAHHQAALDGRLDDLVRDYGARVDYLNKGTVTREFILKDETEYRRNYQIIGETGRGKVTMLTLSPTRVRATYELVTQWQRFSDGKAGGGRFEMVMELEGQPDGGWKIVSQRTKKLN